MSSDSFDSLGLSTSAFKSINEMGFSHMTQVHICAESDSSQISSHFLRLWLEKMFLELQGLVQRKILLFNTRSGIVVHYPFYSSQWDRCYCDLLYKGNCHAETPNSLIQRTGDLNKTKLMLQKIRGTSDVDAERDDLIKASSIPKTTHGSNMLHKILHRKYRPQLVMAIAIPFFQQVTGINVIGFYAPILFRALGLGLSASLLSAVLIGVVNIIAISLSMVLVDILGRRVLFMFGGIMMILSQMLIGSIMAAKLGDEGALSKWYAYYYWV